MGADVLIMPCNTAHYFYKSLVPYFDIPLLNMIEETISYLKTTGIHKAGLLATTGTISSKIYQLAAKDSKLELLTPSENGQKSVMDIIYKGVKAGKRDFPINTFCDTANKLLEDGAQTLILGCTELPLAMEMYHLNYPVTDPTKLLAKAAIHYCGGVIRNKKSCTLHFCMGVQLSHYKLKISPHPHTPRPMRSLNPPAPILSAYPASRRLHTEKEAILPPLG